MTSVLLVTIDSLRADHVGCYGHDRDTTPAIDDLAAAGTALDAVATANSTQYSFPSILTSTYPLAYGGAGYLSEERVTVAQAVADGDVATAGIHSNLWLSRDYGYDRGFDYFYDSKSEPGPLARLRMLAKSKLPGDSAVFQGLKRAYEFVESTGGVDLGQTYKDAETTTDRAVEWVEGVDGEFVAWVHYMDPHHPYVPRPDHLDELGLDPGVGDNEAIRLRRKMLDEPDELTDDEHRTLVDLYDGETRYTDHHVGRLVEAFERAAPAEFVTIVTADHGEEFADHGGYSHTYTMYDEVLDVPLVVAGDAVPAPRRAELLDVAPTVCDLVGVAPPDNYCGTSLFEPRERDHVISENTKGEDYKFAVQDDRWKYIWDRETGTTELYDRDADPGETENLVAECTDVAERFQALLDDHLEFVLASDRALPEVEFDDETERRLRDLGYLE